MECAEAGQADTVTTGVSSVPPAGLSSGGQRSLLEITVLLRQLPFAAIKTELKSPKARCISYLSLFFLWHKDRWLPGWEKIY